MTWTPESISEKEEAELITLCAELQRELGDDAFQELVDRLVLATAAVIERETNEGHPARQRLKEARRRAEQ